MKHIVATRPHIYREHARGQCFVQRNCVWRKGRHCASRVARMLLVGMRSANVNVKLVLTLCKFTREQFARVR